MAPGRSVSSLQSEMEGGVSSVGAGSPVKNMLQPTIGMKKLDVLETNLKGRSRWNRVKMSCGAVLLHQSRPQRPSLSPLRLYSCPKHMPLQRVPYASPPQQECSLSLWQGLQSTL